MFDMSNLIKLINTNNDKIIQKSEVETYLKQQKNESIFTGYFASINFDVEVKTFKNILKEIHNGYKQEMKERQKEAKADKKHFKSEEYFNYSNPQHKKKSLEDLMI